MARGVVILDANNIVRYIQIVKELTNTLIYNKLRVTLTTHASGGLTENDFIMAGIIDELEADK